MASALPAKVPSSHSGGQRLVVAGTPSECHIAVHKGDPICEHVHTLSDLMNFYADPAPLRIACPACEKDKPHLLVGVKKEDVNKLPGHIIRIRFDMYKRYVESTEEQLERLRGIREEYYSILKSVGENYDKAKRDNNSEEMKRLWNYRNNIIKLLADNIREINNEKTELDELTARKRYYQRRLRQ